MNILYACNFYIYFHNYSHTEKKSPEELKTLDINASICTRMLDNTTFVRITCRKFFLKISRKCVGLEVEVSALYRYKSQQRCEQNYEVKRKDMQFENSKFLKNIQLILTLSGLASLFSRSPDLGEWLRGPDAKN